MFRADSCNRQVDEVIAAPAGYLSSCEESLSYIRVLVQLTVSTD